MPTAKITSLFATTKQRSGVQKEEEIIRKEKTKLVLITSIILELFKSWPIARTQTTNEMNGDTNGNNSANKYWPNNQNNNWNNNQNQNNNWKNNQGNNQNNNSNNQPKGKGKNTTNNSNLASVKSSDFGPNGHRLVLCPQSGQVTHDRGFWSDKSHTWILNRKSSFAQCPTYYDPTKPSVAPPTTNNNASQSGTNNNGTTDKKTDGQNSDNSNLQEEEKVRTKFTFEKLQQVCIYHFSSQKHSNSIN